MKHKVGQKLLIKEFDRNPGTSKEGLIFSTRMLDYCGKVYTVEKVYEDNVVSFKEIGFVWSPEWTVPVVLNNSLNKKLYPNRVEWNVYLIPKEAAEKLAKEEEVR